MITKKVILSLVALAGFSAAAVAQLIPPPNHGPGGQRPAPPAPPAVPCCHPLQWQALCTANKFPASPVAGIAASQETGDFIAVASDNNENDYSVYFLGHTTMHRGWEKEATISNLQFDRLGYNDNCFWAVGSDSVNKQPMLITSFDNGSTWENALFVGIGSDYIPVGSEAYIAIGSNDSEGLQAASPGAAHFSVAVGSDADVHYIAVASDVFSKKVPFNRFHRFTARAHNNNEFIAIGSDGTTFVAPVLAPGPTAGLAAPAEQ